ncbi:hypothetical protein [Actinoplanes flavus]|uniref:Secreted protein n=1 Tax=Actinoplanes flavus TaxID=2820290 RepID=A0ABS3V038_9ACTN|nr:hypothetical protein [Actinoplanes flavus]MBO3744202.1 hypothetical protein [Actinoplanes flavus]
MAAAALTGCSSTQATSSATPASTVPAAGATTTAPAPTASSPTAGGTATESSAAPTSSTRNSTAKPTSDGTCTPSETTLLKALRSSKIGDDLAPTDTLTDITCYQGYALAKTHPKEADNAEVVFHYTNGAWQAVNGGTSGYCDDIVPATVRPYLKHC